MRARDAYRLIVARGGLAPALLAHPTRVDHVEVVEIDGGEVIMFWEGPAPEAARVARAVRADLLALDAQEFLARWSTVSS
jgi:spermidine synthase